MKVYVDSKGCFRNNKSGCHSLSFPRKRESMRSWRFLDSCFHRNDICASGSL